MTENIHKEASRASTILTLGILSLAVCGILGPFAWAMGRKDLRKIQSGAMDPSEEGMIRGGMICGIISTILLIVVVLAGILWFSVFAALFLEATQN